MQSIAQYLKLTILIVTYILFVLMFWPFKTAILLAILFALSLNPIVKKVNTKIKNLKKSVLLTMLSIVLLFMIPISLITIKGAIEFLNLIQSDLSQNTALMSLESSFMNLTESLKVFFAGFGFDLSVYLDFKVIIPKVLQFVGPILSNLVSGLPDASLQFLVFIACLYTILIHVKTIKKNIFILDFIPTLAIIKLLRELQKICFSTVISSLITSAVQATIISFAALFAGFSDFLIIFTLSFFASFIPVVGAALVGLTLASINISAHEYWSASLIGIAVLISSVSDNFIRAYLLSASDEGQHPLISLLSIIGSMMMFGFVGIFIGPIVSELTFKMHDILGVSPDDLSQNTSQENF